MATNDANTSHSFRRLLDTHGRSYRNYVLSDSRYMGLVVFLDRHLEPASRGTAVDIGCGAGVIARGLSRQFGNVIGLDRNPDNVALATQLTEESGLYNVVYKQGIATQLPVEDGTADLALLNGVLEWVGLNDKGEKPQLLQRQVLREAARVLKPNGLLYLAIENRWHPRTLLRDPHTHLPLVNALPRPFADIISNRMVGRPFQAYIYGHAKLQRLVADAGFGKLDVYVTFPGYQHPSHYIPIRPRKAALSAIQEIDIDKVDSIRREMGRPMNVGRAVVRMRRRATWGLLGLLAHDFAILAAKT